MCDGCGCGKGEATFDQKVAEVIDSIRPMLQNDGGDIELVGVDEDCTVRVRLQGACRGCPGAAMTLKMGVERVLRERVPGVKEVVAVA
jgi:Fe-S cluster biogenesis protein NfuA